MVIALLVLAPGTLAAVKNARRNRAQISLKIVLLALSVVISVLTLAEGRALIQQGVVHLALLAAFVFFSAMP